MLCCDRPAVPAISMPSTASPSRLPGLDTLRAAAIVAVMFFHLTIFGELPSRILPVTWFGWMGVDLFFVLSGFLIGQQLLRGWTEERRPSFLSFYLRRAARILPAYWCVLLLYFFVPAWRESGGLPPLWKFLTFTLNLDVNLSQHAFSHAWSLCVEEHFYLLLPLLLAALMRRPSARKAVAAVALMVAGGIMLRAALIARFPDNVFALVYYPSWTRLDGLTFGVGLAALRTFRPAVWRRWMQHGHALLIGGIAVAGCAMWLFQGRDQGAATGLAWWAQVFGFPLLDAGLALVTASAMSERALLGRSRIPGAGLLAALAYSLYLTHKEVAHFVMVQFPGVTASQGPASWCLYAAACVGVAGLLHLLVERPVLRLRDRFVRQTYVERGASRGVALALAGEGEESGA